MLLLMIRLHMLLLALAELVKIQHMLQTHMAPLNGRSLLIIGHTHYTLITWKLLMVGGYLFFMNLVVKIVKPLWNTLVYISHSW